MTAVVELVPGKLFEETICTGVGIPHPAGAMGR
jgi:hypothetical protein